MLDKAITHKKEKRKQYRGSKAFDRTCRHGGSCSYCSNNRVFAGKRRTPVDANTQVDEFFTPHEQPDPADTVSNYVEELMNKLGMSSWDTEL